MQLVSVPSSLGGLRGCRHTGVLTTSVSESSCRTVRRVWCIWLMSLVGHTWRPDFVDLVGRTWSPDFVEKTVESTVREGFDASVVRWLCVSLGVERQALHPPSPASSSASTVASSEEEGLHTALFLTTSASTSATSLCTSEEEGLHTGLPLHNVGMYLGGRGKGLLPHKIGEFLGGGGTGPPPHNVGLYFVGGGTGLLPHNVGECMQPVLRSKFRSLGALFLPPTAKSVGRSAGCIVSAKHVGGGESQSPGVSRARQLRGEPPRCECAHVDTSHSHKQLQTRFRQCSLRRDLDQGGRTHRQQDVGEQCTRGFAGHRDAPGRELFSCKLGRRSRG